jgi:ATP-dependent exoDNAse (exonuclease V) beta subunit
VKSLHPFRKVERASLPAYLTDVADAMEILARLHRARNRRPIADTISDLLETTRAHAGLANWPSGEQVLANVLRLLDLARRFEAPGATSFRSFVGRLDDDAARGEANEAPVVEEGTEGVRVMTVHRAKGLEFPVVVLAEPTAPPTFENPSRHVVAERGLWLEPLAGMVPIELALAREEAKARDAEEAVRLAYVAATRARDLLVVPVVGDDETPGWVDVLHPAIYPDPAAKRRPRPAPACPKFGDDSVLERPSQVYRGASASVAPGLHAPRVGTHGVVWWDPKVLRLDAQHDVGLRQQKILEADGAGVADEGARRHAAWQAARAATLARGGVPSRVVRTATELAADPARAAEVDVEETTAVRTKRPHGKRFGTLVHAVLAAIDLVGDDDAVRAVAELQGRLVGATEEEVEAAAKSAIAAQAHPILARARESSDVRRESPVVLRLADGVLAEGVVDLAFLEEAAWTVVDFKTDVELGERRAEYAAQVAIYAHAIAAATGLPAKGVLLCV